MIYKGAIVSQRDEAADDLFLDHIDDLLGLGLARHSSKSFDVANLLRRLVDDRLFSSDDETFPSLAWIHVQEAAHSNQETRSKGNDAEAQIIVSCVGQLLVGLHALSQTCPPGPTNPSTIKVVILTGYLEQKAVLERALAERLHALNFRRMAVVEIVDWLKSSMIVNTVDSFQGQEADIVFVSTVRSIASADLKGLGFAKDQRRACVMLSRASQLMVVVGDAENMAAAGVGQQLLLPKLAWWCSDNTSMFQMVGDVDGSLRPYKLPSHYAVAARPATTVPARQARPPAQAVAPPAPPPSAPPRRVTPLAENGFDGLSPFAKAVVTALRGQPRLQMNLSQLASRVPRPLWADRGSLLVPVREVQCVSLQLDRSEWVATLVLAEEEAEEGLDDSTSTESAQSSFSQRVVAALESSGGRMMLTTLGALIPPADRPQQPKKLTALLDKELGDRISIDGSWLILAPNFARRVLAALESEGGQMLLSDLGQLIPASQRPRAPKKLTALLTKELGDSVHFYGKWLFSGPWSQFAQLVVAALEEAGGRMQLSNLGLLIPASQRPSATKKLKTLLAEELGGVVYVNKGQAVCLRT